VVPTVICCAVVATAAVVPVVEVVTTDVCGSNVCASTPGARLAARIPPAATSPSPKRMTPRRLLACFMTRLPVSLLCVYVMGCTMRAISWMILRSPLTFAYPLSSEKSDCLSLEEKRSGRPTARRADGVTLLVGKPSLQRKSVHLQL